MAVRDALIGLRSQCDLSRWEVTDRVRIDEGATPHSHPVLTLGTGYPHDLAVLASYLHEQIHWLVYERTESAIEELRVRYADPPVGGPHGADSEWSTYLHYVVNFLELLALREQLGAEGAAQRVLRKPYYTAIYRTVVDDFDELLDLCRRYDLVPP